MPNPFWLTPFAVAAIALPALAQTPAGTPMRINASIVAMAGDTLSVRTDDGVPLSITVPPGIRIGSVVERSLADIKPGEFVGSAALRGRDGKLHAQEVHIFAESQRGSGEGHRPMDLPEQTMTNANVDGVAEVAGGRVLKLRYPGGEQDIQVGPEVRVVGMVPGDRSLLKPGAAVTVRAMKAADGAITALSIQAEKDGVKPLL
jgi:hypothetical protein